ncbi:hypothetical protein [Corynebacterium sp.]|uniref:hypothetical protein n=1 Tax=Corynebacterium sp. TaxID=1720 RepID=UPI0026DD45A8|nr:hypothetical protein [Corynebacterium sp.]MDO5075672.1 hypothetical protein [Corynebacterium sp.]
MTTPRDPNGSGADRSPFAGASPFSQRGTEPAETYAGSSAAEDYGNATEHTVIMPRGMQETTQLPREMDTTEQTTVIPRVQSMPETSIAPAQLPQYRLPRQDVAPEPSYAPTPDVAYPEPAYQQPPEQSYVQPAYPPPGYAAHAAPPPQRHVTNAPANWSLGLGLWSLGFFISVILLPLSGLLAAFGMVMGVIGLLRAVVGSRPGGVKSVVGFVVSAAVFGTWMWLYFYLEPIFTAFWNDWTVCSANQGADGSNWCMIDAVLHAFGFDTNAMVPDNIAPEQFVPESFAPESLVPETFAPEQFIPESFAPESFVPESLVPEPNTQ